MKKNKERNHSKQAQKKAVKDARRRATHKPKIPPKPKPIFTSEQEVNFWRAHGVNFIVSDSAEATWTPLFDIYDGAAAPDMNTTAKQVMGKYGPTSTNWPPEGRAALGWVVGSPETLTMYYLEAQRRLKEASDGDIQALLRAPHNPVVWGVFSELKRELAKRTA